jgi:hypothetical protein
MRGDLCARGISADLIDDLILFVENAGYAYSYRDKYRERENDCRRFGGSRTAPTRDWDHHTRHSFSSALYIDRDA